jgi:hypothetical protein
MNQCYEPLSGVLPEEEVIRFLGITKKQLDSLRYDGLPFIKLNERRRLYFESDLIKLFKARRVTMNMAE